MSKVISKVRCYSPSLKNTPQGNKNHLYYIARRNMAIANEKGIPTFGDVKGLDVENASLNDIAHYIGNKSSAKTNIYRGIISLKEENALELGYDNQEEWKSLMQRRAYDIGKILGIPSINTEWVAVVHLKKGNPHLHYMLWDKSQEINDYFISPTKQCKIRELLTKDIFDEELQKYYGIKNTTKNNLRDKAIALEIKAFNRPSCKGKLAYINMSNNIEKEMKHRFKEIKSMLPAEGSLKYAYMPPEIKEKIKEFIKIFVDNNIDFKTECEKYIDTASNIGAMYGESSKNYYKKKAQKELENILGNQFLYAVKMTDYENLQKKIFAKNLLQEMFRFLSILNESNEAKYNLYKNYKGELSTQAKKDFLKNKANASSINWEY